MGDDVRAELDASGVPYRDEVDLASVLPEVDVVYQTRIQRERFPTQREYEASRGVYVLDRAALDRLNPDAIILHPLPRVDEIAPDVDADPRAAYFRQAHNGVFIRMALLSSVIPTEN
jgi:aspartate carbamoyltransferase catalytic subunit